MIQRFIHHTGQPRLLLFFAGWGADEQLFPDTPPEGYDMMLCYDYTDDAFDFSLLSPYSEVRLMAWSLGVWSAASVFNNREIPWEKRIAINGTPWPIDDERGIPISIFEGTLNRFSEITLHKFRRRMCGSANNLETYLQRIPSRNAENLRNELQALYDRIVHHTEPVTFAWDKAIIGASDFIFPVTNQQKAWRDVSQLLLPDTSHYCTDLFSDLIRGKEELWTRP